MKLNEAQVDALTEIINIGVGKAASVLNAMLDSHVVLQVPYVRLLSSAEYLEELSGLGTGPLSSVQLGYQGDFSGKAQLVFPTAGAMKLVTILTGEDASSDDFDRIRAETLSEVGNIVINGLMGAVSNMLGQHFIYTVPTFLEDTADNLVSEDDLTENMAILLARTRFSMESHQVEGNLILIFEIGALDAMMDLIGVA